MGVVPDSACVSHLRFRVLSLFSVSCAVFSKNMLKWSQQIWLVIFYVNYTNRVFVCVHFSFTFISCNLSYIQFPFLPFFFFPDNSSSSNSIQFRFGPFSNLNRNEQKVVRSCNLWLQFVDPAVDPLISITIMALKERAEYPRSSGQTVD